MTEPGAPAAEGPDVPGDDLPAADVPGDDAPATDLPGDDAPAVDVPGADVPGADAPVADMPGDDAPGDDLGAPTLAAALEALLLVADEPMPLLTLAQVTRRPVPDVEAVVRDLARQYDEAGRGFRLREVAGGWRYYTSEQCAAVIERFVVDGQQARLTQAALETLAVIAYRQPVSRSRVSAIRGVNVDGVVRTLVSRGLVAEAGTEPDSAALLYRTTPYFLERMGLATLDELPPIADLLPDLDTMDDLTDLTA
ncbi:MAG: SMC-Scp complex subunit ScpB [Actinomycetota bacterium]|nr:MAG: SMC-Scp complex subunit ScpB [Actinomycetota bacterium]